MGICSERLDRVSIVVFCAANIVSPSSAGRFFVPNFFAFCEDLLHCVIRKVPPAGASPPWLRPQVRVSPY